MTDRELLERAGKAAGMEFGVIHDMPRIRADAGWTPWNPLTDDGDALRLAVRLNIGVQSHAGRGDYSLSDEGKAQHVEVHNGDPLAATRRAIVRAAAALADEGGQ